MSVAATSPAQADTAPIAVTLAAERQEYSAGEDVRIKVMIRNETAEWMPVEFAGAWSDVPIAVYDSAGHRLRENIDFTAPSAATVALLPLAPGEEALETFAPDGSGFVSTKTWGFAFSSPGNYRIFAVRNLGVTESTPPSNVVTIVVR